MRCLFLASSTALRHGVLLLAALAALSSCATRPDAPGFDNPYDPHGTGPDPYDLMATVQGDSVRLSWTDNSDILEWAVFRSTTSATEAFSLVDPITIQRAPGANVAFAGDHDFAPAVTNWYRLQGTLASGELRSIGLGDAAAVTPAPLVRLAAGGDVTETRYLSLELRSDLGESVELSNTADFASVVSVSTEPGVIETVSFTLPTVSSVPATAYVHARSIVGGSTGVADSTAIQLRFTPILSILSGSRLGPSGESVVDTNLVLGVAGGGVIRARVADTPAALDAAPWDDSPDSIDWNVPAAMTAADTVYAQVEGDLGVTVDRTLPYAPAATVGAATLGVVDDLESTLDPQIRLVSTAEGAAQMMLSEDPGFSGASWVAFADTTDFLLSPAVGEKTVFARYRNAFDSVGTSAVARIYLLGGS